MPIPRKKLSPPANTIFHYLVLLRCYMDDVPLAIYESRKSAEAFASRWLNNYPKVSGKVSLPSTPTHLVIIEFRDGLPNGQIVREELMLGRQLLNL